LALLALLQKAKCASNKIGCNPFDSDQVDCF
jgi:hypothetical protein